jgi:hypothetical protein
MLLSLTACVPASQPTLVPSLQTTGPTPSPSVVSPAPPGAPLLVGAYYYPWYGSDGRHWREGYRGTPLLGEYDSTDEGVIDQQITWASEHGIDFFAVSWWGSDSYEDGVTRGPFLRAIEGHAFRFAILYEAPGLLGMHNEKIELDDDAVRRLSEDLIYLAGTTFEHPNYLRIDGRPALFVYLTRTFTGSVDEALARVRSAVVSETDQDPFLIGDEVYWHAPSSRRILPYDGITAYNMHTSVAGIANGFEEKVRARYQLWAQTAEREGIAFVPSVIPGFDDTAVRPEVAHPIIARSPDLFAAQLYDALALASGPARMVMITSWNEWHEDTSIEPSEAFGFDYLQVLRGLVTGQDTEN